MKKDTNEEDNEIYHIKNHLYSGDNMQPESFRTPK